MKNALATVTAGVAMGLPGLVGLTEKPNIILILADDLGINDIGAYTFPSPENPGPPPTPVDNRQYHPLPPANPAWNSETNQSLTPVIDSLGRDGVRMTSFYAPSPACTPSRAGILTGSYPTRLRMEGVILPRWNVYGIHSREVTLAERLQERGYRTGLFGKWHLGAGVDFSPRRHGFDVFFGLEASNDIWPENPYAGSELGAPPLQIYDGESPITSPYETASGGLITMPINTYAEQSYLLEAMTEQAIEFIEDAADAHEPFFLFFPTHAPHVPVVPHPDYLGSSQSGYYYDVVAELDARIGEMLTTVEELGLTEDTVVIFTSDNGTWYTRPGRTDPHQAVGSAYPYRGSKRESWDGGARMPFLLRYPRGIPGGTVTDALGSGIDLLPTLLNLAGAEVPDDRTIDGIDLWAAWTDPGAEPRSSFILYGDNDTQPEGIRRGTWKLRNNRLYDLSSDVQESTDVGSIFPDIRTSLSSELSAFANTMVRRSRGTRKSVQIELDQSRIRIPEGGSASLRVRLSSPSNATVTVTAFSGDTDVRLVSGSTLRFTSGNYHQWQTVTFAAAEDADWKNGGATFRASSGSLHLREIVIQEIDNDPIPTASPDLAVAIDEDVIGISLQTITGGYYLLQKTTSLREGNWESLGPPFSGNGQLIELELPTTEETRAFFRVLISRDR